MRLESYEQLVSLSKQAQRKLENNETKKQVKVHLGTCGISSGANKILDTFLLEVEKHKLSDTLVLRAACIGLCGIEPTVTVQVPGKVKVIYTEVTPEKVSKL